MSDDNYYLDPPKSYKVYGNGGDESKPMTADEYYEKIGKADFKGGPEVKKAWPKFTPVPPPKYVTETASIQYTPIFGAEDFDWLNKKYDKPTFTETPVMPNASVGTMSTPTSDYQLKTQKSKGLSVLRKIYKSNPGHFVEVSKVNAIVDVTTNNVYGTLSFPCFARPCPKTPRHGFVDSRTVKNQAELDVVIAETKAADPDGEVMLLPFIESKYNMIWTPAFMGVGLGHDGATAGKGSIRFPLAGINDKNIKKVMKEALITDFPYVEAVSTDTKDFYGGNSSGKCHYKPILTQLRNGPVLDTKVDFIEQDTLVTKVILPEVVGDNLLAWEDLMLASKEEPGVVVYHPGGTQADHFSIHARANGVPCITSFEPKVGQLIPKAEGEPVDYQAVLRGLVAGDRYNLGLTSKKFGSNSPSYRQDAALMLMGLHNSAYMVGKESWWFGAAISIMLRLGSMALRGESRHSNQSHKLARSAVYKKAAPMRIQAHAKSCSNLIAIFKYAWAPTATGIGGRKWAQCGLALGHLFNAVREFVEVPGKETYAKLTMTFNSVVNQAHNGGWWMNKFIDQGQFNEAQKGSLKLALETAPHIWEMAQTYRQLTDERVERTLALWRRWPTVDLRPPKASVVEVSGDSIVANKFLTVTIRDKVLRDLRLPFTIAVGDINRYIPQALVREYYVRGTPNGIALDMCLPGIVDEPFQIWEEAPIEIQAVETN